MYTIAVLPDDYPLSIAAIEAAGVLAQKDPGRLTDLQLSILQAYAGANEAQWAAQKRDTARHYHLDALPPASTPRATRAAATNGHGVSLAPLPRADDVSTPEKLDAWATQHGAAAVPVTLWAAFVGAGRQRREAQVAALESRVKALEDINRALVTQTNLLEARAREATKSGATGCRWGGVWEPNHEYRSGELVTGRGGLWLCICTATAAAPGSAPDAWRLILRAKKDVEP